MKTVTMVKGDERFEAIPLVVKFYMSKNRLITIWSDLIHKGDLTFESKKSEVIAEIRSHLRFQGYSVYNDWYEDTDETPVINGIIENLEPIVEKMFPELCKL